MFIGHFAPALIAATHRKAPSLPVLLIGAQLVDWVFFGFLLTGIEQMRFAPGTTVMNPMDLHHMPYTHSLIGSTAFAAMFAALIFAVSRDRTGAIIGFFVVLSHWFLDLLVHTKDLTLAGSPPKLGLGLWDHPVIAMPLEIGIVALSLWLYARSRRFGRRGWGLPLLALTFALLVFQAINWFGPPPQSVDASTSFLAWFAFGVVALLGWWTAQAGKVIGRSSLLA
jgi:hypothetical protein